jgi:hypothetical protein
MLMVTSGLLRSRLPPGLQNLLGEGADFIDENGGGPAMYALSIGRPPILVLRKTFAYVGQVTIRVIGSIGDGSNPSAR